MNGRNRRLEWERAVYVARPGMTNATRVLLLRMLNDMDTNGIVSVPRSKLAGDLGVNLSRITERINLARALGLLDVVRRGRPGVTAVYQALLPDPLRSPIQNHALGTYSVPLEVPNTEPTHGAEYVPRKPIAEVRMHHTQVVVGPEDDSQPAVAPLGEERSNEETGCPVCAKLARDGVTSGCYDHYQETAS